MGEIKFKSSLSRQEIKENFAGFDFFDGLMECLTEAFRGHGCHAITSLSDSNCGKYKEDCGCHIRLIAGILLSLWAD